MQLAAKSWLVLAGLLVSLSTGAQENASERAAEAVMQGVEAAATKIESRETAEDPMPGVPVFQSAELLIIQVSGSENRIFDNIDSKVVRIDVSNDANVTALGRCDVLEVHTRSSGSVSASKLLAQEATVRANGSGDTHVSASESLDAKILGSGNVVYYGEPSALSKTVLGSGAIRPAGD